MTDEKIDTLFKEMCLKAKENGYYKMKYSDDFNPSSNDYIEYKKLVSQKIQGDLGLLLDEVSRKFALSEKGKEVCEVGGWIKWKQAQKDGVKEKEAAQNDNLNWNTKLAKWQVKTKYLPYILSAFSLLVAALAYFKEDKPSTQQLSKDEVVRIIDSISASNQTKRVDSVHIPKNQVDSSDAK